jgi:hypothetical protein
MVLVRLGRTGVWFVAEGARAVSGRFVPEFKFSLDCAGSTGPSMCVAVLWSSEFVLFPPHPPSTPFRTSHPEGTAIAVTESILISA